MCRDRALNRTSDGASSVAENRLRAQHGARRRFCARGERRRDPLTPHGADCHRDPAGLPNPARRRFSATNPIFVAENRLRAQHGAGSEPLLVAKPAACWARCRFYAIDSPLLAENRLRAQHGAGSLPWITAPWLKTGCVPSTVPVLCRPSETQVGKCPGHAPRRTEIGAGCAFFDARCAPYAGSALDVRPFRPFYASFLS